MSGWGTPEWVRGENGGWRPTGEFAKRLADMEPKREKYGTDENSYLESLARFKSRVQQCVPRNSPASTE
jgi:hypothetical protein